MRGAKAKDSFLVGSPFPGLRPFSAREHDLYFGRERQVDELLRRLRSTHFLSVVGTSGSGKSSLVRAGLVPALSGGRPAPSGSGWRVAIMRPGSQPIESLAEELNGPELLRGDGTDAEANRSILEATLRRSSTGLMDCIRQARLGDRLLLVVDQFEEIFRYRQGGRAVLEREEAVAFVKLLLEAAAARESAFIVLTMRSDFIGDCMEFPGLPEAINEGQYLVPRMTREELRRAISGPVSVRKKGTISPRLVSRLLNEVGDNPDQLPVLQHALMRVWGESFKRQREGTLENEDYDAVGTMERALDQHAEKAFGELASERERGIAECLFRSLTDTDRDGRGVRRPVRVREVCDIAGAGDEEVIDVIDRFRRRGRAFLMPPAKEELTAESIVDLSHESLMRNWRRLAEWAEDEAESADMYRRLCDGARRQEEAGLWRGLLLERGLQWREKRRPTAAWATRYDPDFERAMAFLDRSRRARDEYVERQEREARVKRRWLIGVGLAALALVFLVLFALYVIQEKNRLRAVSAALTAEDPLLKALVLAELDIRSGRRLEMEALALAARGFFPRAVLPGRDSELTVARFSPDGKTVATAYHDGVVRLWPASGRGGPRQIEAHEHAADVLVFDAGGDRLLTASLDGTVRVWDLVAGGEPLDLGLPGGAEAAPVTAGAFSPDGARVAAATIEGALRVWSLADPLRPRELRGGGSGAVAIAFTPDGTGLVTASTAESEARIWPLEGTAGGATDPTSPTPRRLNLALDAASGPVAVSIAFPRPGAEGARPAAPDDIRFVAGYSDGRARVWSGRDGTDPVSLDGHAAPVRVVTMSGDGRLVATAAGHEARVWLADGSESWLLPHSAKVESVVFSPRGDRLLTVSDDRAARIWRSDGFGEPLVLEGHRNRIVAGGFSADGRLALTGSAKGRIRLWNTSPREPLDLGRVEEKIEVASLSPRGGRLVTGSDQGVVRLWELAGSAEDEDAVVWTEQTPGELGLPHQGMPVTAVEHSPDGERLAVGYLDGSVHLWPGGESLPGGDEAVSSISFGPDGRWLAALGIGGAVVRLWRPGEGAEPRRLEHDQAVTGADFSPVGGWLATASADGQVRLWPLDPEGATRSFELGVIVSSLDFSPDGALIVVAADDGTARILPVEGEGEETVLSDHDEPLTVARFSPDGARVLTASEDGTARVRGVAGSGEVVLKGHDTAVLGAAFNGDGSSIVTVSEDGSARVWHAASGREVLVLRHGEGVRSAAFSPRGSQQVLTLSNDGGVRLWRVTAPALSKYLRESSTACLASSDRRLFLGEPGWIARGRFRRCEASYERTP